MGRFISPDTNSVISATPTSLTDKNLFAYCDNNPIIRKDSGGKFWETVFDIVSLVVSVVDVVKNPSDPWAWAGLVGDTIDLIPFVAGVGEVTRVISTTNKIVDAADDVHDVVKTVDNVTDTASTIKKGWNVGDDITNLTKAGNTPSWSTVKSRYWKNEAYFNSGSYSKLNLDLMEKGRAPLVKYDLNGKLYPMELHHPHGRIGNNFWDFKQMTPWDHSIEDIFRNWRP